MATGTINTGEGEGVIICDGLALDAFIERMETSDLTKRNERRMVSRFLSYCEAQGLNADRDALVSYKERLIEDRHTSGTINAYLSAGQRFIRWMAEVGHEEAPRRVRGVPMGDGFRRHEVPVEAVRAMASGQGDVRKGEVGRVRDVAIIRLMAVSGCRCCEVSAMDVGDCFEDTAGNATIRVRGKGHVDKDEEVSVPAQQWRYVKDYLSRFRPDATPDQPLFVSTSNSTRGRRITAKGMGEIVKEHLRAIGLDAGYCAHGLRHFACSELVRRGYDISSISRFARHTSVAITQRYVEGRKKDELSRGLSDSIG